MAYFNVNWNDYTDELSKLAAQEEWSNTTYPDKKILTNYMVHTYKKLTRDVRKAHPFIKREYINRK